MNLEQIKNDYAVSKGFTDWDDIIMAFRCEYLSIFKFKDYEKEVMILAQKECLKLASENVFKKDVYLGYGEISESRVKEEITNENNIIK